MENIQQLDTNMMRNRKRYSLNINKFSLIFSDIFSFIVGGFIAYLVSVPYFVQEGITSSSIQLVIHLTATVCTVLWFWGSKRHYSYRKPFWDELEDMYKSFVVIALASLSLTAVLDRSYSVLFWGIFWIAPFFILPLFRLITKKALTTLGTWQMPCVIIGDASNASEAYQAILSEPSTGFRVQAFVDPTGETEGGAVFGVSYISKAEYLNNIRSYPKVFIAMEKHQSGQRDVWLRELTRLGIRDISIVPALRGVPLYGTDISHFFSHEIMMLRIKNNLPRKTSRFMKRCFDITVSAILLTLLSPLFAYIAYKVSRDGGSSTYGHERVGLNGKKFKCLKFRSMVTNSKEVLEKLLANDPAAREEWEREFKLKNDPRVTPIGGFLRKTSLDELPQLWNVLKGEMSLVGPRPVIVEELERYNGDVDYYLMAKPGMSGLWQVSGRSDTDYETRVYLDSWYVKNWSLWYDIVILFKTVGVVINRDGAY